MAAAELLTLLLHMVWAVYYGLDAVSSPMLKSPTSMCNLKLPNRKIY